MKPSLIILILTTLVFVSSAFGAGFKGFARPVGGAEPSVLKAPLSRYTEANGQFLIALVGHAAFYKFPKEKDYEKQVRSFLMKHVGSQKQIEMKFDPITMKVFFLGDAK